MIPKSANGRHISVLTFARPRGNILHHVTIGTSNRSRTYRSLWSSWLRCGAFLFRPSFLDTSRSESSASLAGRNRSCGRVFGFLDFRGRHCGRPYLCCSDGGPERIQPRGGGPGLQSSGIQLGRRSRSSRLATCGADRETSVRPNETWFAQRQFRRWTGLYGPEWKSSVVRFPAKYGSALHYQIRRISPAGFFRIYQRCGRL